MTHAEEDRRVRHADENWRNISFFLAGVVITLLGAWATHSVTREDLAAALTSRDALIYSRITNVEETQKRMILQFDKLDRLGDDMIQVKMALGIEDSKRRK